ncbi:MAG TPA: hypothetical protein DCQ50_16830 [Chryseobacterium sp.]|nr:hypothetical protein [Chryseobacterium sp.]
MFNPLKTFSFAKALRSANYSIKFWLSEKPLRTKNTHNNYKKIFEDFVFKKKNFSITNITENHKNFLKHQTTFTH